jgi:hypothetical protein
VTGRRAGLFRPCSDFLESGVLREKAKNKSISTEHRRKS